jgi:hypothetical protein
VAPPSSGELEVRNGALLYAGVQIAHYDTGGSLVAVPGWDMMGGYTIHMIHYMLAELEGNAHGDTHARITRQRDTVQDNEHAIGFHMRYFYDEREIVPSEPIVLAGPLSIQAYRAQPGTLKPLSE